MGWVNKTSILFIMKRYWNLRDRPEDGVVDLIHGIGSAKSLLEDDDDDIVGFFEDF